MVDRMSEMIDFLSESCCIIRLGSIKAILERLHSYFRTIAVDAPRYDTSEKIKLISERVQVPLRQMFTGS